MLAFNKPYLTGNEEKFMAAALLSGRLAGSGQYGASCEAFFEGRYGFLKAYLTTSCTHALEMAALLIDIRPGDEVIMPSYTFVSSANPFVLRGAKVLFVDSEPDSPNLDVSLVERLITPRTKAILTVHYGGIPSDLNYLRCLADKHGLFLIEDAAQAIDSYCQERPAGSFGHLATFSFHQTKNITCGEGGLLIVNDERFIKRAEILREKGTNRSSFMRGEVEKYNWVDVGSSYVLSDLLAACLKAQLDEIDNIQHRRLQIWQRYHDILLPLNAQGKIKFPFIGPQVKHNAHSFFFTCVSNEVRRHFINFMTKNNIQVQFHYMPLHSSPFYKDMHGSRQLPMADMYKDCLIRLPLYGGLGDEEVREVASLTYQFFDKAALT